MGDFIRVTAACAAWQRQVAFPPHAVSGRSSLLSSPVGVQPTFSDHRCQLFYVPVALLQVYTLLTGVLCDETADYLVAFRSEFVVSQASLVARSTLRLPTLHAGMLLFDVR